MTYIKTRNMILVALFAALTAVGAFIRIEIPFVPFTLQFFFCALAGIFLGARLGMLSQIVYVGIGLAGIPVFTKGGGPGYILQPTFGYLLGFIVGAYIIGKCTEKIKELNFTNTFMSALAGLMVIYLVGVPYLYMIFNLYLNDPKSIGWAVFYGFAVSIGGDLLLIVIIALNAPKIVRILRNSGLIVAPSVNGKEKEL